MDVLRVGTELEKQILSGRYGSSGSRMPGLRELAASFGCSYVTMTKAASFVRERFLLTQSGGNYYVIDGRTALKSGLEQRLAANRRKTFAIQCSELNNHYYMLQSQKLHDVLKEAGYDTIMMISGLDHETERKQLQDIIDLGISGVFYYPHYNFDNQKLYERYPLPMVAIGRMIDDYRRSMFSVDNNAVGQLAASHLIEKGYRHFAYIGYRQSRIMKDMRLYGFRKKLTEVGFELRKEDVFLLDRAEENVNLQSITDRLPFVNEATGVFCYHDMLACSLVEALGRDMSVIPDKVGIIGCDDLPITSEITPTITTVHYPYTRISRLAVQTALEELERGVTLARKNEVMPRVIGRQTTGKRPETV